MISLCQTGANDLAVAGAVVLMVWPNSLWAGDRPSPRRVLRDSKRALWNAEEPMVDETVDTSLFILLTALSVSPLD